MGKFASVMALVLWAASMPTLAFAQASIVGVVRDSSGAVLPGVTVEAASPVLIEKVRTVVTDGTGQYRVVDLRPGVYTITFTLAGFSTVKREGVELGGNFTATVNTELRVGSLEETLTVTGESPIVDVQSTRQQQAIDREVISAIPTGRAFQHVAALIPAMQNQGGAQDVGGTRGPASTSDRYVMHGGVITDSRIQVEGLGVGSADGGGASGTFYMPNMLSSEEIVINTSGATSEAETGGVHVNVVPREGGNTIRGSFFANGATESMQSSNYTQALQDQGLRAPNRVDQIAEISGSFGGPVFTDKLWYFFSARYIEANNYVAGMYYNLNAGNPNAWTYEPDFSRQAISENHSVSAALRLTWQATPRNKFNVFWDDQPRCVNCPGGTATTSPEGQSRQNGKPNRVQQATWSSPLTSRILLEAGFGTYLVLYSWENKPPMLPEFIRVTEQAGIIPGLNYRGTNLARNWNGTYNWRTSMAYVTGAHSVKVGYQGTLFDRTPYSYSPSGGVSYRFNNGVPNQLTQAMEPLTSTAHLWVHSLYVQDQWTIERLTLQGGLRYDYFGAYFPDQGLGPNNFLSEAFFYPGHQGVSFNDLSPRFGAAYDLFGTGKTAVKVTLNKYMLGQESSQAGIYGSAVGPVVRLATSTTRSWNDANRDYVPDCDLRIPTANGECGALANRNFGTNTFSVTFDPEVTDGWGIRPYQWEFSASVQQELLPRVSATVGYFRRWYGNFAVTDNLATEPSDYTFFSLPVPADPRLPNSGGRVTVADITPGKFGQVNNIVTAASNYGKQVQRWHGVDAAISARPQNGWFLQGGVSVGRTVADNCALVDRLPEVLERPPTVVFGVAVGVVGWVPTEYCRIESPFLAQLKGFGGYTIPRLDVQVSGTFQNIPGPEILANYNAPNAVVAPVLGRNLSGGAANTPVTLVSPLSMYGERLNQIDLRVAKILRFGRARTQIAFDLYNAFNSSAVQAVNNTFGPRWQTPTSIITARLAKVGMQLDF